MRAARKWTARAIFVMIVGAIVWLIGSRPTHVSTGLLLTKSGQTVPFALALGDVLLCIALGFMLLGTLGFALTLLYRAGWDR